MPLKDSDRIGIHDRDGHVAGVKQNGVGRLGADAVHGEQGRPGPLDGPLPEPPEVAPALGEDPAGQRLEGSGLASKASHRAKESLQDGPTGPGDGFGIPKPGLP
jgi:hypothetical protein